MRDKYLLWCAVWAGLVALGLAACDGGSETAGSDGSSGIASRGPRATRVLELLGVRDSLSTSRKRGVLLYDVGQADSGTVASDVEVARLAIPVEVHQVEEGYALLRQVAGLAARGETAERVVRDLQRPLAERAVTYLGARRPCVAVVVDLDPLVLAGGHSFETDLVQTLGAESITHGGDAPRRPVDATLLVTRSVELVIATARALEAPALLEILERRLEDVPVHRVPAVGDVLWLGPPEEIDRLLDAWASPIDSVRTQPSRVGSCARTPRSVP